MSQRTGRPKLDKPKTIEVKARIDEEMNNRLKEYCRNNNTSRTEVVRKGLETVLSEKKE